MRVLTGGDVSQVGRYLRYLPLHVITQACCAFTRPRAVPTRYTNEDDAPNTSGTIAHTSKIAISEQKSTHTTKTDVKSFNLKMASSDVPMDQDSPPIPEAEPKYGGFTRFEIELEVSTH